MTSPEDYALTYFGERGFEFWETGGGCTAFGKNLDDGRHYVLVTCGEDPSPPVAGLLVTVGLYNDDDLYDGIYDTAQTFDEAITKLNALIEKHVK